MASEQWGWEYRDVRQPPPAPFDEPPPALEVPVPLGAAGVAEQAERIRSSRKAKLTGAERKLRRDADADYRDWLAACVEAHGRFELDLAQRTDRCAEHIEHELATTPALPAWVPLRPLTKQRVDVFGGSARGWERLLTRFGLSLIAGERAAGDRGAQLTVLDVSQRHVSRRLGRALAETGVAARGLTLPEQLGQVNLLAGLTPQDIGTALAHAIHAADPLAAASANGGGAAADARLLAQIAGGASDGPVTFGWLRTGLEALLREQPAAEGEEAATADDAPEASRRARALRGSQLSEAALRSAAPRLLRIARALERLAELADGEASAAPLGSGGFALRVIELSGRAPEPAGELLRQLLVQVTIARLRVEPQVAGGHDQLLVVAGADRLRREDLAQLDELARGRGTRLVLLFAALRAEMLEPAGGARAAVVMRLEEAAGAELAANAVGRRRVAASAHTVTHGRARAIALRDPPPPAVDPALDALLGPSPTAATAPADAGEEEPTPDLVYEVTPAVLQGLSDTAFLLLDPQDPGSPRLGDCEPEPTAG